MAGDAKLSILLQLKDEASKKLDTVGQSLSKVGSLALGLGAGAVAGVGALATGIVKLASDAQQIPEISRRFDALTSSIGVSADVMLNQFGAAVQSTMTNTEMMTQANKLMSMGLADSADEAAKLAQIAYQLGDPTQSVTANMENLALMLANQSIPRLDSFGISGAQVKARMEELQNATEGMSRETAFMTAFLGQAEVSMARVGAREVDLSVQMAQMKAQMQNAKDAIGVAFIPVLSSLVSALAPVITQLMTGMVPAAQKLAQWITGSLAPGISQVAGFMSGPLAGGISDVIKGFQILLEQGDVGGFMDLIADAVYKVGEALGIPGPLLDKIVTAIWGVITVAAENLIPKLQELWTWFQETLPVAIQTLSDFWQNVLQPAIQVVGDYIRDPLLPLFDSLVNLGLTVAEQAVEAFAVVWDEVLRPALEKAVEWFGKLESGASAVKNAVQPLIDKINGLADAVRKLDIAKWLADILPGSQPKAAQGMYLVAIATDKATSSLHNFANAGKAAAQIDWSKMSGTWAAQFDASNAASSKAATGSMKDRFASMFGGGEDLDSWASALPTERLSQIAADLEPFMEIANMVAAIIKKAKTPVQDIAAATQNLWENLQTMMETVVTQLGEKEVDWTRLRHAFARLAPFFEGLKEALDPLAAVLEPVGTVMDFLGARLSYVRMDIENFMQSVLDALKRMNAWADLNRDEIDTAVTNFRTSAVTPLIDLAAALQVITVPLDEAYSMAMTFGSKTSELREYIEQFVNSFIYVKDALKRWNESDDSTKMAEIVGQFAQSVKSALEILAYGFPGAEGGLEQGVLSEFITSLWQIIENVKQPFEALHQWISITYKNNLAKISLHSAGASIGNTLAAGINSAVGEVKAAAAALRAAVEDALSALNAWNAAYGAGHATGAGWVKGVKDATGTHSPSKEMMAIGKGMMEGLSMGIGGDNSFYGLGKSLGSQLDKGIRDALGMHSDPQFVTDLKATGEELVHYMPGWIYPLPPNPVYEPTTNEPGGGPYESGAQMWYMLSKLEKAIEGIKPVTVAPNISIGQATIRSEQDITDLATIVAAKVKAEIGEDINDLIRLGVKM